MPPQLPPAFAQRLQQQLGPDFDRYLQALENPAPVSIRLNPLKFTGTPALEPVPWSSFGYYLPTRPSFTLDPLLHAGVYYVQEASSMFLEKALQQAVDLSYPLRVLDLCGAPGGKSTLLASVLPPDCLLVSNEVIRSRAHILAENLQKWGVSNVVVTNSDPRDFQRLEGFFDVLVIDAPCSGEGLFRKDPEAMNEWSEANVKLCSERQKRILVEAWEALRPGGTLIYSTCTYSPEENELNLEWLSENAEAESVDLQIPPEWQLVEKEASGFRGYQFYPHLVHGEGLFLAVVKKAGEEEASFVRKPKRPKFEVINKSGQEVLKTWILENIPLEFIRITETIISAFPQQWLPELEELAQHLRLVSAGTEIAEAVKKEFKPLHPLALSPQLNKEAFATAGLSFEQALRFLHKEDIPLPGIPHGWVLVQYKGHGLGWMKNMGNRTNNYYPKEWRIRMSLDEALKDEKLGEVEVLKLE